MSNFLNIPTFKSPPPVNVRQTNQPSGSATGNPRNKTALKPGRSLMDWVRLSGSGKDLAGTRGRRIGVTPTELHKHNTVDDAWMCLRGKVYNVTSYMEYHPGGIDELLRGVGTDATKLFDDTHQWVNYESMLAKCFIGPLVSDAPTQGPQRNVNPPKFVAPASKVTPPNSVTVQASTSGVSTQPIAKTQPRFEWFQTDTAVNLVLYTRWKQMRSEFIVIDKLSDMKLQIILRIEDHMYKIVLELGGIITFDYGVEVSKLTGKVSIDLHKATPNQRWASVTVVPDETEFVPTTEIETVYRECTIQSVTYVTHDTKLFCIAFPEGARMVVPVGHHVQICEEVLGMKISRNYTVINKTLQCTDPLQEQGKCLYLMIKIYEDGALTPIIGRMKQGDKINLSRTSLGTFDCSILENKTDVVLFAAGTGFTPMVNLIRHCFVVDNKPERRITLVFFNKQEKDIPWQTQLDEMIENYDGFHVYHILSQPHSGYSGLTGRIRKELVEMFLPKFSGENKVLVCACGPTPFTEAVVTLTKEQGYAEDAIHAFLG